MTLKDFLRSIIDADLPTNLQLFLPDGRPVTGLYRKGDRLQVGWGEVDDKKVMELVSLVKCSPGRARELLFQANWNVAYAATLHDKINGSPYLQRDY